jgi:hypothetical protein
VATGNAVRAFQDAPAVRSNSPLIIGVTGASWSGKTYSGLRLCSGIQRVFGGDIYGIDTEANRMLHYADYFNFRHVPLLPPHGPADYLGAINHCASKGARIILIDSMTHEHDGEGGVLDQIEAFLEDKCGDDYGKRQSMNFVAQIKPKRARKKLNQRIVQLGHIVFILCYRAEEKIKPRKKGEKDPDGGREPESLGWQAVTTSKLPYDMTVRFLLTPGCEGVPVLMPANPAEKLLVKQPEQFKDWFESGKALSEDMGERLALWASGKERPKPIAPTDYEACTDRAAFDALEKRRADVWKAMPPAGKDALKKASDAAKARLAAGAATTPTNVQVELVGSQQPFDEQSALAHVRAQQSAADVDAAVVAIRREFESRGETLPLSIEPAATDRKEALQQY